MGLTNEYVGPKILAKIKIYVLTRAELLITLCYEIPCTIENVAIDFEKTRKGSSINDVSSEGKGGGGSLLIADLLHKPFF